jgi:acetate kinase
MTSPITIPIEMAQSYAFLSLEHQKRLFGNSYGMQIARPREHMQGQFVYAEHLRVLGKGDSSLNVKICGPVWEKTTLELTPKEAKILGVDSHKRKAKSKLVGSACVLQGPAGVVELSSGIVLSKPSLFCSPEDADLLSVKNGSIVKLCLVNNPRSVCEGVVVRVHPTYSLVAHVPADVMDVSWLNRGATAQLIFS